MSASESPSAFVYSGGRREQQPEGSTRALSSRPDQVILFRSPQWDRHKLSNGEPTDPMASNTAATPEENATQTSHTSPHVINLPGRNLRNDSLGNKYPTGRTDIEQTRLISNGGGFDSSLDSPPPRPPMPSRNTTRDASRLREILSSMYEVCVRATSVYINNHRVNWALRHPAIGNPFIQRRARRRSCSAQRYSPYPSSPVLRQRSTMVALPGVTTVPEVTESLLTNISTICNMLWGRAQRDRLTVPESERTAAESMACLLRWAETIAFIGDMGAWMGRVTEEVMVDRAEHAAKNICAWLGDEPGWEIIEALACDY